MYTQLTQASSQQANVLESHIHNYKYRVIYIELRISMYIDICILYIYTYIQIYITYTHSDVYSTYTGECTASECAEVTRTHSYTWICIHRVRYIDLHRYIHDIHIYITYTHIHIYITYIHIDVYTTYTGECAASEYAGVTRTQSYTWNCMHSVRYIDVHRYIHHVDICLTYTHRNIYTTYTGECTASECAEATRTQSYTWNCIHRVRYIDLHKYIHHIDIYISYTHINAYTTYTGEYAAS